MLYMRIDDSPTSEECPFEDSIFMVILVRTDFFLDIFINFCPLSSIETEDANTSSVGFEVTFSLNGDTSYIFSSLSDTFLL